MKNYNLLIVCCCLLLFMGYMNMAHAADVKQDIPPSKGVSKSSGPIHIKSDLMEANDQAGVVVFTGSVVATQDDLTINSDKMEVFYSKQSSKAPSDDNAKRSIDRIVASGHVHILKGTRTATAEKAIYEKPAEKIILTGSAQVIEGQNRVKGDTITMFVNENRSVVQGTGKDRVEAVVFPSEAK